MRPACRIRLQPSVAGVQPASRVRFAGPRPPLTPLAHRNTGSPTHSEFNRGEDMVFTKGYAAFPVREAVAKPVDHLSPAQQRGGYAREELLVHLGAHREMQGIEVGVDHAVVLPATRSSVHRSFSGIAAGGLNH